MIELREFLVPAGLGALFLHILICDRFGIKPSYGGIYPSTGWLIASRIDPYKLNIPQVAIMTVLLAALVIVVCYAFDRGNCGPGKDNQ